ncbi:MAG: hypothetical protein IT324_03870 [Anaerolineae bacterium]|nr:hypothetical protein [Anaerolineae bacterium]
MIAVQRSVAHGILLLTLALSACATSAPTPTVTAPPASITQAPATAASTSGPTVTRTPLPSLTPSHAAQMTQGAVLPSVTTTAANTNIPGPAGSPPVTVPAQPSSTSALLALTPNAALTPLPTQAALQPGGPPPLDIKLPPDWKFGYQLVPIRDQFVQASMNMAVYQGPVTGGQGTIIILWGFPSLAPPPTLSGAQLLTNAPGTPAPDLQAQAIWADGLRLLQGTVLDLTCNVGHFGQRTLTIGGQQAIGEYFAASQCQGEPDTAGWFAGLKQGGGTFLFYAYIDPVQAYNQGRPEVQQILDTVAFHTPSATRPAAPPTNTSSAPAATTTPVLQ